jgi:hypothetical protein
MFLVFTGDDRIHAHGSRESATAAIASLGGPEAIRSAFDEGGVPYAVRPIQGRPGQYVLEPAGPPDRGALAAAIEAIDQVVPPESWRHVVGMAEAIRRQQREDEHESRFGPIIARGTAGGRAWTLRGLINSDGARSMMDIGGGGAGALPFQDLGWMKVGHLGTSTWSRDDGGSLPSTLHGVVSKQAVEVEVRLTDGATIPAQIVDIGDDRANFFVAVWPSSVSWTALLARDAAGTELESRTRGPRT